MGAKNKEKKNNISDESSTYPYAKKNLHVPLCVGIFPIFLIWLMCIIFMHIYYNFYAKFWTKFENEKITTFEFTVQYLSTCSYIIILTG